MDVRKLKFDGIPFKSPEWGIGALGAVGAAAIIAASADIALVIDDDGVIKDLSVASQVLREEGFGDWVGRSWSETVTIESQQKILDLLDDARKDKDKRRRQVNHPSAAGVDVPIDYLLFRLEEGGPYLAFGQEQLAIARLQQRLVEAQQAVEREYSRLRHAETRYRLLFKATSEPTLIVDVGTLKIREANDAAVSMMNEDSNKLAGRSVLTRFDPSCRGAVETYLSTVLASGRGEVIQAAIAKGGPAVSVKASVFRQDRASLFLVRLASETKPTESGAEISGSLEALIDNLPDAFAVTDMSLRIKTANQAFVDLAQLASPDQAIGQPIEKWLGRSDVETNMLVKNLREHHTVRRFATAVRGELGGSEQVEVSGVAVPGGDVPCYGFSIRPIGAAGVIAAGGDDGDLRRSVEKLTELVGRVPLKEIVRETTDMIERMCIEAALDITGDNRASAADVLGLSRQSLYVKLRRHGLGENEGGDNA